MFSLDKKASVLIGIGFFCDGGLRDAMEIEANVH